MAVAVFLLLAIATPLTSAGDRGADRVPTRRGAVRLGSSDWIARSTASTSELAPPCVNAYIRPVVSRYLGGFGRALGGRGFRGQRARSCSPTAGRSRSSAARSSSRCRTMESGPVGGALGLCEHTRVARRPTELVAFDMGGTTAKVRHRRRGLVEIAGGDVSAAWARPPAAAPGDRRVKAVARRRNHRLDRYGGSAHPRTGQRRRRPRPGVRRRGGTDPPSPTRTSCSVGITPAASWAARCALEASGSRRAIRRAARLAARPRTDAGGVGDRPARRGTYMALAVGSITVRARPRPARLRSRRVRRRRTVHAVAIARELGIGTWWSRRAGDVLGRGGCSRPICATTWCARSLSRWWRPTPRGPGLGTWRCSARSRRSCLPSARP